MDNRRKIRRFDPYSGGFLFTNRDLNWLLVSYEHPDAWPGVVANAVVGNSTLRALRKYALGQAGRCGCSDHDLIDDALGNLFLWVAASRHTDRLVIGSFNPRRYFQKLLASFVRRAIDRDRKHRHMFTSIEDLPAIIAPPGRAIFFEEMCAP